MNIEQINLSEKVTNQILAEKLNEVIQALNANSTQRDRGPKSERSMTEEDAIRIISGDLKDKSHTEAAQETGLSYGQVYSARKGFTFKTLTK